MAVVAADHGVGGEAPYEVVVIFPREIECSRHRLRDVAGRTESTADHQVVRLLAPRLRLGPRQPIPRLPPHRIVQGLALRHRPEHPHQRIRRSQHVGMRMGQADVLLHDPPQLVARRSFQRGDQCRHLRQPADVLIGDPAFPRRLAPGIAGEEGTMILFDISIPVPARLQHPSNVALQPGIGIVAAGLAGLAGVLWAYFRPGIKWDMGAQILLLIFAAVTLGGLGTAFGALLGSLVVGLLVEVSSLVIPADLKYVGALVVLIVILLVRPQGILGRKERIG